MEQLDLIDDQNILLWPKSTLLPSALILSEKSYTTCKYDKTPFIWLLRADNSVFDVNNNVILIKQ